MVHFQNNIFNDHVFSLTGSNTGPYNFFFHMIDSLDQKSFLKVQAFKILKSNYFFFRQVYILNSGLLNMKY